VAFWFSASAFCFFSGFGSASCSVFLVFFVICAFSSVKE